MNAIGNYISGVKAVSLSGISQPVAFPLTLGSNLSMWINGRSTTGKTLSGPYNSVINSLVTNDSSASSFTNVSGQTNTPKFSGKWIYAGGAQGLECSDKASYKFVHDNTIDYELFIRFQITNSSDGSLVPIVVNNNFTGAEVGFAMFYDNRITAQSRTNAIVWSVTNGTTSVFNRFVNNQIVPGAWTTVRIKYVQSTKTTTIFVNGTQVDNFTSVQTHSTANSTGNLTLFKYSTTNTSAGSILLKHFLLVKRLLTTQEITDLSTYLLEGSEAINGSTRTVNFYYLGGQSNMAGDPSGPPLYLQSPMNSMVYGNFDSQSAFEFLDWPINQNKEYNVSTVFGPILEFGYRMSLITGNTFMYHYADGGTNMYTSWNVDTNGTTQALMFAFIDENTDRIPTKFKYVFDATVIVRGVLWRQGEADTGTTNPLAPDGPAIQAAYKSQFTAFYKKFLDTCEARGWNITKCRLIVSKLHYVVPYPSDRPYTAEINAALQDVAVNFRTDNPTYASKCLNGNYFETTDLATSDGTHFLSAGMIAQGLRFYDALSPYINE